MPKITFIGAGSTVFAKNLLGDILNYPELSEATITLFDIDEQRLQESKRVAHRIVDLLKVNPTLETTTDRRVALDGADYAIAMFQIGGYKPGTVVDFEVPKKYGLRQTIGDTLGIGGIMRALRTIPVMLDMSREMEEMCPNVTFLNYVNPMAMNCWAIFRSSKIHTVGLCHSVPHTAAELAEDLGLPVEAINYLVAGINHVAFYLKFEDKDGRDLYARLRQVMDQGRVPDWNRVRYEVFRRLGYFVTESSEHFSEYVPWFIKRDRPDLIDKYHIPLEEYLGRCEAQIKAWEYAQRAGQDPLRYNIENLGRELEPLKMMPRSKESALRSLETMDQIKPSVEYGSQIIYAIETGQPARIYGNVANHGLIDNLPPGCCVEVPCLVDKNGIQPVRVGSLPPQLAALMQTNINVQALTVEAALTRKREHIYHAAMLDPHTAAELDLEQIWNLVDELIEAHGEWLPEYD
jgi:alpha-galactosidase